MTTRNFRAPMTRRGLLQAGAGLAGILATGRAPLYAQTTPKKLLWAHIVPPPESGAVAFDWMAKEFNARANGALTMEFHGGTLIPKELEIMNAVKTGNVAIGGPAGAAATVFPEMGVFLVPYLVKDYNSAYAMFNGKIGERLDKEFQEKYKLKVLFFYDYGYRHFWTNKKSNRRTQGSSRPQDSSPACQGVFRYHHWPRRQCGTDGLGRGRVGGQAGGDRRRRSAHR